MGLQLPVMRGRDLMKDKRTIKGRPISPDELGEPLPDVVWRSMLSKYSPGDVASTIEYLLSDTPLEEARWREADYEVIPYEVEGKQRTLYTNPHSEGCVRDILRGSFDLGEYLANLVRILHLELRDPERLGERMAEIVPRLESGVTKEVI